MTKFPKKSCNQNETKLVKLEIGENSTKLGKISQNLLICKANILKFHQISTKIPPKRLKLLQKLTKFLPKLAKFPSKVAINAKSGKIQLNLSKLVKICQN